MERVILLSPSTFYDPVFCSKVEYQCEGFLEKNKDRVNEEQINVLKSSKVIVYYVSTSAFSPFLYVSCRNKMSAPSQTATTTAKNSIFFSRSLNEKNTNSSL